MKKIAPLFIYEFKKICYRKIVWVIGSVILLLCAFLSISDLVSTSVYYEVNGKEVSGYEMMKINRQNARDLSGKLIDDTLLQEMNKSYTKAGTTDNSSQNVETSSDGNQMVVLSGDTEDDVGNDIQPYTPIYSFVQQIMGDSKDMLNSSANDIYAERENTISENRADQMLNEKEMDYWKRKDTQIKTPFTYAYSEGWSNMWEYAYPLNYMLLLMLAICLSNIFSIEYVRKTDAIIMCSRYGKTQLYYAKIFAGIDFGIIVAILFFGVTLLSSIIVYGADGFNTALQIAFPTATRNMSIGNAVCMLFLLFVLISVLYSVGIMFLSIIFKNSIAVMAIPVGIMFLTMLIDIPYQFRIASQIYDLLPTNLLVKWELWDDRLVSILEKCFTNFEIAPFVYVIVILLFLFLGKRKYQKYQIMVR